VDREVIWSTFYTAGRKRVKLVGGVGERQEQVAVVKVMSVATSRLSSSKSR
jgi:hypothetical protein